MSRSMVGLNSFPIRKTDCKSLYYFNFSNSTVSEDVLRYVFVLFSLVGFVFFDLLYFAVVITYVSQGQLIQYYIVSIMEKVKTKTYSLEDAIKVRGPLVCLNIVDATEYNTCVHDISLLHNTTLELMYVTSTRLYIDPGSNPAFPGASLRA